MLSYQQWDAIADSYIPLLLTLSLIFLFVNFWQKKFKRGTFELSSLILGALSIYTIMFIDNALKIWPSFNSDYSTHTALALVFVFYLCEKHKIALVGAAVSMCGYIVLMMYQEYHTFLDIITTSIVVLPTLYLIRTLLKKFHLHNRQLTNA
ncbi:MAG: hypothetical protein OQJ89_06710 [Kangiellaceae bacterium]|nr:hypothetical protein [Kangiellaceae bacterium]MCW8997930.1 hypothetical protein [Kangiellaceae bacterium]MCW9016634.1 hypothetical protein [Kangiellaceae bacterium]